MVMLLWRICRVKRRVVVCGLMLGIWGKIIWVRLCWYVGEFILFVVKEVWVFWLLERWVI